MHRQQDYDIISNGVDAFVRWLEHTGYESYDPYDIWGTRYGRFSRCLYYRRNPAGVALVAPLLSLEIIAPGLRKFVVAKARFATADAQLLMGFLHLHAISRNIGYLDRAKELAEDLLRTSIPGFSGLCWGYPFDWQNSSGMWPRDTPFITATPYCYEAFVQLADATDDERYLEQARSVARFVHDDLNDTPTSDTAAAGSYSPFVHDKVINASAYRAFVLFDAAERFGLDRYVDKAKKNLNFILEEQQPDGSWLYAAGAPGESFIDHFHTCFVLKNLLKINRLLHNDAVREALHRGHAYYRQKLFYEDGLPKYFAIEPRLQIAQLEMYNMAEAITLGVLLKDEIPSAYETARSLALRTCREFQLPAGYFVTRVYRGGVRHTTPFLRWPQAQLFHALTALLASNRARTARATVAGVETAEREAAMTVAGADATGAK